jgi:hypothetical protein
MSAALSVVAPRIGQLIRLLGSNQDGEVVAAARAIGRTLKSAGADFHTLAATIERSEPEVSSDRAEYWRDMARWLIEKSRARFSEKEQAFLHDMTTWPDEPTDRQAAWLRRIFESAARQRARTP